MSTVRYAYSEQIALDEDYGDDAYDSEDDGANDAFALRPFDMVAEVVSREQPEEINSA